MTRGLVDQEHVDQISRTMALRKVAQPEDVARQVVVLASDALSGHVTGQVITVAGGMEGRGVHQSRRNGGPKEPPCSSRQRRRLIAVSPRRGACPQHRQESATP